jgi:hypothetical protein
MPSQCPPPPMSLQCPPMPSLVPHPSCRGVDILVPLLRPPCLAFRQCKIIVFFATCDSVDFYYKLVTRVWSSLVDGVDGTGPSAKAMATVGGACRLHCGACVVWCVVSPCRAVHPCLNMRLCTPLNVCFTGAKKAAKAKQVPAAPRHDHACSHPAP